MNDLAQVLIVDDEPSSLFTLEMLLSAEPYEIALATNGQEALDQVEAVNPDVILLDVMMPNMTGFEVCERMKDKEEWQHIPIILVTALDGKDDLVRGLNSGADEFVTKPVSGAELRARVRSMLRIKKQYDEIEEALKLREDMADMIVHDLRSPLHALLLYTDLLEQKLQSSTAYAQLTTKIRAQTNRLNSMLTDMLVLARMKSGKLALDQHMVDMSTLVMNAIDDQEAASDAKRIQIAWQLPDQPVHMRLDSKLLERTLDNLLTNAIKFSPNDSTVTIRLEHLNSSGSNGASRHGACLQVVDQGPGIAEEYRERIFDRYEIVTLKSEDISQIGIGLAFCKMVVEAHGGRIFAEANEPTGSVFTLEIFEQ
jgi:two-component system sensor histidine kinase/response regulator